MVISRNSVEAVTMRGRFFSRCWQVCVYNVCVLELQVNRFPSTLPERRKREEKGASRVSDPVLHAPSSSSGVIRASGGGGGWRVNKRRHGDFPLWCHPSSVQSWSVWRSARRSPVVGGLVLGDGLWRLAVMDSRAERLFYQSRNSQRRPQMMKRSAEACARTPFSL